VRWPQPVTEGPTSVMTETVNRSKEVLKLVVLNPFVVCSQDRKL